MEPAKLNSIMLIGLIVTIVTFGGGFISTYIKLENRLAVIEYQVTSIRDTQRDNAAVIRGLKNGER